MQEFRTGATRQNMETVHAKEEVKRLKDTLSDLRGRLAELEARVSVTHRKTYNTKNLPTIPLLMAATITIINVFRVTF